MVIKMGIVYLSKNHYRRMFVLRMENRAAIPTRTNFGSEYWKIKRKLEYRNVHVLGKIVNRF